MNRIKDIYDYRDMVFSLVRRELRGRYQKSVLGMLWTFLNPFFQIVIYTLVFTFIFPSNIENYYIYLMTGIIPWNFFTEALGQGAGSIVSNADMTKKIYFPREVLTIASVTAKFINMLLAFVVIMLFLVFSRVGVHSFLFGNYCLFKGYGIYCWGASDGMDLGNANYVCFGCDSKATGKACLVKSYDIGDRVLS